MRLKIEAVITCVNYPDFLRVTLPLAVPHFDRINVVTTPEDKETIEVCRQHGVWCRPTKQFHKDGANFAKSRGIDYGISYLSGDGWICHLDADIALPNMTRQWLEWTTLDEQCIYGIDRFECHSWEDWDSFQKSGHLHHDYWCRIKPPPFPLSSRIAIKEVGGWLPIGFFQLWHGKHGRRYPLHHGNAERTDVLHAMQWEPENRRLIPEVMAIHLESEAAEMGTNWNGRKTKLFGPPQPKSQTSMQLKAAPVGQAVQSESHRPEHHHHEHHHHHPRPYC